MKQTKENLLGRLLPALIFLLLVPVSLLYAFFRRARQAIRKYAHR